MSVYTLLSAPETWEEFFLYRKENRGLSRSEEAALRSFIDEKAYLPVTEAIGRGELFAPPAKTLIRKTGVAKKRVVYTYSPAENTVLKLLAYLLLRAFDDRFSDDLYSFRVRHGVVNAMSRILKTPGLRQKYTYKVDIHDYFNSVPVDRMNLILENTLQSEPEILSFLTKLLSDDRVFDHGELIHEKKGLMAGTPTAVFLANLYLTEMDEYFEKQGILYARYSDDIMVFCDTEAARDESRDCILRFLADQGLTVNPEKEASTAPGEPWTFLGIRYDCGTVDISVVSKKKLKDKMRRRVRSLRRWQAKKGASNEQTAKAFIRAFNRKFFEADSNHELTWARWYFPLINTDETLREIDRYMQDCIRYLASGTRTKGRYRFTYEDMKRLGYRSLVNEWYKGKKPGEEHFA